MVKNNSKVSASHILIMHKESQDSRSSITKDSAKKKLIIFTKKFLMEK